MYLHRGIRKVTFMNLLPKISHSQRRFNLHIHRTSLYEKSRDNENHACPGSIEVYPSPRNHKYRSKALTGCDVLRAMDFRGVQAPRQGKCGAPRAVYIVDEMTLSQHAKQRGRRIHPGLGQRWNISLNSATREFLRTLFPEYQKQGGGCSSNCLHTI